MGGLSAPVPHPVLRTSFSRFGRKTGPIGLVVWRFDFLNTVTVHTPVSLHKGETSVRSAYCLGSVMALRDA